MAEILIKGLEMPKGNDVLIVDSAGTITKLDTWTGKREATDPLKVKARELPPHGRLVDADKISCSDIEFCFEGDGKYLSINAPTIIEASKERE